MNRRTVIRNVAIFSAGAVLLPSCYDTDKISLPLKHLTITDSQGKMLAALSDTIIPATHNFIGAKDLNSHEFVLIMVDDCASPEEQKKFSNGMTSFVTLCKEKWDRDFENCTTQQRNELLTEIEQKKKIPGPAVEFYNTVKKYTLQSFSSSKEYLTDIRKYKLVPGPDYKGCVPVSQAKI
jgi:hypothetical protein